jgi:cyclic pyranopterin phosphate synthase
MNLSHLDAAGRARMVDVGAKPETERKAVAEGSIGMSREAYELVESSSGPKGDVLTTAQLAGTMGAKKTAELIPLCHAVRLDHVEVRASLAPDLPGVLVQAVAKARDRTGVEMEALTAVAIALLTVYDMVKATGHSMEIGEIRLLEKLGGTGGDWKRSPIP